MADPNKGTQNAPGQQKLHTVRNPQTNETREITQEQWRNRTSDSSLTGFERVDSDEGETSMGTGSASGSSS